MKKWALLIATLVLGGCTTHWPQFAVINPQPSVPSESIYQGQSATLQGVDSRKQSHVISIKEVEEKTVYIPSENNLGMVFAQSLGESLSSQGLRVSSNGNAKIRAEVIDAAVDAIEVPKSFYYNTKTHAAVRVTFELNGKRLVKEYRVASAKEEPSEPDMAEMEQSLSRLLGKLIEQICKDASVQSYLRG